MPTTYNKIIINGETKIDLTGDTIDSSKVLNGYKAHDRSGAQITGTCTFDVDSSDATVVASELLATKTAYANGNKLTGTMPNRGGSNGTISDASDEYVIQNGYHDGSGKVSIDSAEKAKLVAANIREGVTILGVTGSMSGTEDAKAETVTVTPTFSTQNIVPNDALGYNYLAQVNVNAIPVTEVANDFGGLTLTVG